MKNIGAKLLFVLLLCAVFTTNFYAQNADKTAENQAVETLGEDERLPFMQSEQHSAANEPTSGGLLLKTFGAMLLIIGLLFGGAWTARKMGFGNLKATDTNEDLKVLSSISLGNGRTISSVQFGSRVIVVGSTAQSFTVLAEEKIGETEIVQTPRSVAEILAEENYLFEEEFEKAQSRLGEQTEKGAVI